MTGGTEVDYTILSAASSVWDGAADGLDGAWRRLHGTSGSPMDAGVAAAFGTFRERWVDEIKRIATRSQSHADSLSDAVTSYTTIDDAAYERMRALLPFDYRDSTLDPLGSPPGLVPTPEPGPPPTPPTDSAPEPPTPSPGPSPTPTPTP
ncbi:hypothetical protein [Aeromicrobium sp. NPDC092404]|uniref:hypothetical protein n=1 Tax=Aeromicrobium sp. NPDC092404 TaxID=3154976 RepID=UPI00341C122C